MSAWALFKRKEKAEKAEKYTFSDEDRESSLELRKIRAERKKVLEEIRLEKEKAQLKKVQLELEDFYADEEEEETPAASNMEDVLLMQLLQNLGGNGQAQAAPGASPFAATHTNPPTEVQPPAAPVLQNMNDDEITAFINQFDRKQIRMARVMPENVLRTMISQRLPVDEDTINRAINIIKKK